MPRFVLYNNDVEVAHFEYTAGTIHFFEPLKPTLLPMQIREATADSFTTWLRDRAIDLNTLQHRQLMHELLGSRDKTTIALSTHMFSISDAFTCFEEGQFQPRNALCMPEEQNQVSDFILVSSDTSLRMARIATPNASTDGSFTKTWKYEDGAWWLYKLQSQEASRSEYEISRVLLECGWDAAEYAYDGRRRKRIRSKNFVGENEFFEPYDSLRYMFEDRSDDEEVIAENIASLGPTFEHAWNRILLADAFFMNTDRHMRNFGVIRSAVTGEILRMAPNFDNNQAYKANPGGAYSGAMLSLYAKTTAYDFKRELAQLVEASARHPYLMDAVEAGKKYL